MTTRDFAAELNAAREACDWAAHERIWEERRAASVDADEAGTATRIFARADLNHGSPVVEFADEDALEERGGCGDEVYHNPADDTFSYDAGGPFSTRTVPNPVPGDVLKGAALVIDQADAEFGY